MSGGYGGDYMGGQNQYNHYGGYPQQPQQPYGQQQQYGQQPYVQQQQQYNQHNQQQYVQQQSYNQQPYEQQQQRQQPHPNPGQQGEMDISAFFDEVSSISEVMRQIKDNIGRIDEFHSRSLGTINEDEATKRQLDSMVADTRNLLVQVKDRIKKIEVSNLKANSGDLTSRKQQTANLRKKFMDILAEYQKVENNNRQKYRDRMERQFRIVKPSATQEEVEAALDNDDGGQIFAQSLMNSTRYGAAKDALQEVQKRHDDIKKIERTIEELANLFQEMQILVDAQDTQVAQIEEHATQIQTDMEQGVVHIEKAHDSARSARRKKWYCFFLVIILLVIAAALIYLYVVKPQLQNQNQNQSQNKNK